MKDYGDLGPPRPRHKRTNVLRMIIKTVMSTHVDVSFIFVFSPGGCFGCVPSNGKGVQNI